MFQKDDHPTVYSTESGRVCSKCGQPNPSCKCKQTNLRTGGDGIIRLSLQSKGRKGKTVTLITGLTGKDEEIQKLASEMKRACGTGGTVKDGIIEIQGDHREILLTLLKNKGLKVKKAGGA